MAMSQKVTTPTPGGDKKITRDDLEAKFRSIQDDVQTRVESRKQSILASGALGLLILVLIFFFLGKRSGKKKSTIVEIRRL
jgi:uncharacterized membrane protein YvbJ